MNLQTLDGEMLAGLIERARLSPRRRQNLNLHASADAACQRFFNAMEPDSYVVPHRHHGEGKEETLIVVRGCVAVLCFDDEGSVRSCQRLSAGGKAFGTHVPLGCWHSVVCLESGSVFLEAKGGPYVPGTAAELAPWAPPEGSPEAVAYLAVLREQAQT